MCLHATYAFAATDDVVDVLHHTGGYAGVTTSFGFGDRVLANPAWTVTGGTVQAAEDSVHELQQQLLACEKRAQHAAAAEAAALLRAQAAEARAAGAESKLKEAAETSRKCMSGMHAVEGSFETVNSKLDEFSTRMDFAGALLALATCMTRARYSQGML